MSLFAVRKDQHADRLISWPRAQNDLFEEVRYTELPDPSILGRLHLLDSARVLGFGLYVANMFQDVLLPPWLVEMFPMERVPFVNLPSETQRGLMAL